MPTDAELNVCVEECFPGLVVVRMKPVRDVTSRYEEVESGIRIQRILSEPVEIVLDLCKQIARRGQLEKPT
jgi:hypothetical protein